jgi:DNA processing protein
MTTSGADLEPLLRLASVEGVGPGRLALLMERYGTAERALGAPRRELELLPGVGPAVASAIALVARSDRGAPGVPSRRCGPRAPGLSPRMTPPFPGPSSSLPIHPISSSPAATRRSWSGRAWRWWAPARPPRTAARPTTELAGALAHAGYAVVSGMARGIDSCAHAAALEAGGATIGVLGHGIDRVYPPESRALFARVRERGLLLTEFLPGESPRAGNFPRGTG